MTQVGNHGGGGDDHHHKHSPCYWCGVVVTWLLVSISIFSVVSVSTVITVRYTAPHLGYNNDGFYYAPTDTRIIPVSNVLCQGLELTVTEDIPSSIYMASLFMLDSPPTLTGHEVFSFTGDLDGHYMYDYYIYNYYIYPGSNFTVSVCIKEEDQNGTFYVMEGNKYYDQWAREGAEEGDLHTFSFSYHTISAQCADGKTDTFSYQIEQEDNYFLLFDFPSSSEVNMSFYRTLYEWSDIINVCSESTEFDGVSCSVSVPLSLQTAFLAIEPKNGSQVDWSVDTDIGLNITCIPRIWMYILISLAILTGLVAILLPILVCIIVYLRKINKNTARTEPARAPLLSNPPLANRHVQKVQKVPDYGSN